MAHKVWFQLMDARGQAIASVTYARLTDEDDVADFRNAVKEKCPNLLAHTAAASLSVFESNNIQTPLHPTAVIGARGQDSQAPLLVIAPGNTYAQALTYAVTSLDSLAVREMETFFQRLGAKRQRLYAEIGVDDLKTRLPRAQPLIDAAMVAAECISLDSWAVGEVHSIPAIASFFNDLGGCTENGKLLWRQEDHDVVSLLLGGWLGLPGMERVVKKKSLLFGSPGVGKSTLLCVLVFHVVFKHKKNVLLYRQQEEDGKQNCLVYLGYDNDQLVYFTVTDCDEADAEAIYCMLGSIWLFLDGFEYLKIPEGLMCFHMLTTSQQVDLKSGERCHAYTILHSCWKKGDLVKLAHEVYGWSDAEADERFHYSGGSVQEFVRPSVADIALSIERSVKYVEDGDELLSWRMIQTKGSRLVDRLRHAYVVESCRSVTGGPASPLERYLGYWEQTVDSEYAIELLADRVRISTVEALFKWARAAGPAYATLACRLFHILIRLLASYNMLEIRASPYNQSPMTQPKEGLADEFKPLNVPRGSAWCYITEMNYNDELKMWTEVDEYSCWHPENQKIFRFDAVIKLKDDPPQTPVGIDRYVVMADGQSVAKSDKRVRVAFLQLMVSSQHGVDADSVEKLKAINETVVLKTSDGDQVEKPVYVLLYPSRDDAEKATQAHLGFLSSIESVCDVRVGYYRELGPATAAHSSNPRAVRIRDESNAHYDGNRASVRLVCD